MAIMARSLKILAVVGTQEIKEKVKSGETVVVDGIDGIVLINPMEEELKTYEEKKKIP